MNHDQLQSVVAELLQSEKNVQIERLSGGGNNQAYKISSGESVRFLKLYHQDPEDIRQRGQTEFRWLRTLWESGVRNIPQPYGFKDTDQFSAGLYEFIGGRPIQTSEIEKEMIGQASTFIRELNQARTDAQVIRLPSASEACFSFREHLDTVERRIARLDQVSDSESPTHAEAAAFISKKLKPLWNQVSKKELSREHPILSQEERILSPSDFGFHNALMTPAGRIRFLDFEYAGWDDPAKLVCDFFNQVSIPIPLEFKAQFLGEIEKITGRALSNRVEALFPLIQIKWICILLNHFLPSDARRKKFALQNSAGWESLLSGQLQKAKAKLATLPF